MTTPPDMETQAHHLAISKVDPRVETAKGFAGRAIPALVTFGIGAAALAAVALGGIALASAFGIGTGITAITGTFGGLLPTIIAAAGAGGLSMGLVTGLAGASRAKHEASDHNDAIDIRLGKLQEEATQAGVEIPARPIEPDAHNPAKENGVVQGILARGKQTFSPGAIAMHALQDTGIIRQR